MGKTIGETSRRDSLKSTNKTSSLSSIVKTSLSLETAANLKCDVVKYGSESRENHDLLEHLNRIRDFTDIVRGFYAQFPQTVTLTQDYQ
ncbi:unnamed protein product [Sphenostylis stenocarpa]|uniref:Uncharacterized protein n=1 Tax=Sphenostylis stenocarpa TaxID=92480 RepID=A0AA86VJB7_9FABA|nr:unnamed protein product [Sphenostylis stenocarpa]